MTTVGYGVCQNQQAQGMGVSQCDPITAANTLSPSPHAFPRRHFSSHCTGQIRWHYLRHFWRRLGSYSCRHFHLRCVRGASFRNSFVNAQPGVILQATRGLAVTVTHPISPFTQHFSSLLKIFAYRAGTDWMSIQAHKIESASVCRFLQCL